MSNQKDSASKGVSEAPHEFTGPQQHEARPSFLCYCGQRREARVHQPELNLEDKKSGETDDPHPGYDCGNTCVICKDGLRKIRQRASSLSTDRVSKDSSESAESCQERDWTAGDVVAAYPDGTIVLDDGITTWNDIRAKEFLKQGKMEDELKATQGFLNVTREFWQNAEKEIDELHGLLREVLDAAKATAGYIGQDGQLQKRIAAAIADPITQAGASASALSTTVPDESSLQHQTESSSESGDDRSSVPLPSPPDTLRTSVVEDEND